jgi:hypothetical protein
MHGPRRIPTWNGVRRWLGNALGDQQVARGDRQRVRQRRPLRRLQPGRLTAAAAAAQIYARIRRECPHNAHSALSAFRRRAVLRLQGLRTNEDMKSYAIYAPLSAGNALSRQLRTAPAELVIQFSVRHEQRLMPACGGGYIKLLPKGVDVVNFDKNTPFM